MEAIEKKYQSLLNALKTLEESLRLLKNPQYKHIIKTLEDSVIQRFEYSIDAFWKFLKLYLQEKHGMDTALGSPRAILKEAAVAGLLNKNELQFLQESISDRNLTSHTYNEELAEIIISHIPNHYEVMKTIIERIVLN